MEKSIRYQPWVQYLLLNSRDLGISTQVLEEFIKAWDAKEVYGDERELLVTEGAGA